MNRPEVLDSDDESTPSNSNGMDKYQCTSDDDNYESEDELMNPYEGLPHMELAAFTNNDDNDKERRSRGGIEMFDPFSSLHVRERRRPLSDQQQQWRHDDLLEMEEEINFLSFSNDAKTGRQSHNNSNEIWRSGPSCNSDAEFGERSPLAGVGAGRGSSEFYGRSNRANFNGNLLSRVQQIWTKLTSFVNESSNRGRSPFTGIAFSQTNSRRMKFSQFRMLLLSSSILLMIMTMGTIRHVFTSIPSDSASIRNSNLIYEGDTRRPNSLVLKKMENAKRRWWKKNHVSEVEVYGEGSGEVDGSGVENEVNVGQQTQEQQTQQSNMQQQQQVAEVITQLQQQQQKQQQVYQTDASEIIDLAISKISNATHSRLDNVQVPVIVETGEDGSLLIKLPPPKMGTAQPVANEPPPIKTNIDTSVSQIINNGSQDDDTVYIKLPYQQQQPQHRALSTKEEVDPPLRGASIHSHPNLERRPPPPLQFLHKHDENRHHSHHEHSPGVLDALRNEFGSWMKKHGKRYGSSEEKERRFDVWKKNHFRISEKNQKHGPCRMTGKAVFGHNLFSDLEPEEFQDRFLTGYRGPGVHDHDSMKPFSVHAQTPGGTRRYKSAEMKPPKTVSVHPTIQRKLKQHTEQDASARAANFDDYKSTYYQYRKKFANDCDWWDVSCMLRWIFGYQYIGGTREPVYDESTYPDALDWRNMGVVSSVHAQGSCGACWAITAVETIESAYAIKTGDLLDLAEEEVIACDGTCEMCNGGWPQNAYKYVMKHDGLPVKNVDYDGDFLYYLTATLTGEGENVSENDMASYFAQTCPAGVREDGGGGGSGSGSRDNGGDGSNNASARYGRIEGYGYATERCVCYTDGSGCDCDDQDEQKAVLNIASYGPAAVCLEASLWQSYEGGIMTSDTGCGSAFLDMNHCVQVVGYAFTTSSNNEEGGSADHSGSRDGGSRDGGKREGYWIVKNQWSQYWGMNGYAYLAMGDNTCGILNDMTQVYM